MQVALVGIICLYTLKKSYKFLQNSVFFVPLIDSSGRRMHTEKNTRSQPVLRNLTESSK